MAQCCQSLQQTNLLYQYICFLLSKTTLIKVLVYIFKL